MKKLTAELSLRDFAFILRFEELLQNIYVIDSDGVNAAAEHPSDGMFPWPVVLCPGAYSKKHVFCPGALSVKTARARVEDFRRRIQWTVAPRDAQHRESCRTVLPAVVRFFVNAVRDTVVNKVKTAVRARSRLPAFVRFTIRWLRDNHLRAVISDKDGVFALCRGDLLNSMISRELAKSC